MKKCPPAQLRALGSDIQDASEWICKTMPERLALWGRLLKHKTGEFQGFSGFCVYGVGREVENCWVWAHIASCGCIAVLLHCAGNVPVGTGQSAEILAVPAQCIQAWRGQLFC
eukprot:12306713-Ditylum_brightwellii.AAC.1